MIRSNSGMTWRKASRSQAQGQCVEVANTLGAMRDSKNPTGPVLAVSVDRLVDAVKAGHYDR